MKSGEGQLMSIAEEKIELTNKTLGNINEKKRGRESFLDRNVLVLVQPPPCRAAHDSQPETSPITF